MKKWNLFLLLFLLLSTGILAQSVVADEVLTNSPLYYNHTPNIARASTGELVAVWKSAEDQIVYSQYDESFGTWSPPVQISSAGDKAEKAGVASDHSGNIYCVWQERATSDEDYAIFFKKIGAFDAPKNLTGNDAENEECSIIVDDNGRIFVAWNTGAEADGTQFVKVIYSDDQGATWSDPAMLSSEDGIIGGGSTTSGRPYLTAGLNGKVICSWHEQPDGFGDRESHTNQFDGTNWLGETVFNYVADSANTMYPAVAIGSDDMVYMATVSYTSPERFFFVKKAWGDAEWPLEPTSIVFEDDQLTKPFMVLDNNDNIYVTFRRDNAADTLNGMEEVAYITSSDAGNTWSEQVRLSRENYDAGYVSVAQNVQGSGIDVLWRESFLPFVDDDDTTAIVYGHIDLLTDVENENPAVANKIHLYQNYPNPFNPTTKIRYNIPESGNYQIIIYNTLGEEIRTLVSGQLTAGEYSSVWNGKNDSGMKMSSGIYFYQLKSDQINLTKKMILIQ